MPTTKPEQTIAELVQEGSSRLDGSTVINSGAEAQALLRSIVDVPESTWPQTPADTGVIERYLSLIERRNRHEPLEYLVGFAQLRQLKLSVGHGVYVPKPETNTLIDVAIAELRSIRSVDSTSRQVGVDLCTGSGIIALTIAVELEDVSVSAVELDPTAASWTQRNITSNAAALAASNSTVEVFVCDALSAPRTVLAELRGQCDFVACNPPYVGARGATDPSIRDFAPSVAINAGADGLNVIRDAITAASELLKPGGRVYIEHEEDQDEHAGRGGVPGLMRAAEVFVDIRDHADHQGKPRVTSAVLR